MANISKEERERRAAEAATKIASGGDSAGDRSPDGPAKPDMHVTMVRDPDQYPAPHIASVHRSEVRNYYPGGWEVENVD